MKNIGKILFFFLSLCFITSCMQGTEADLEGDSANHNFALNGADLSQHALANIQVYAFKGADQNNMGYNHRVFNMTQNDNILSMVMPTDTWDFVLLSAESGDLGAAVIPAVGSLRQNAKMWECPSAGGKLLSAPEIITARTGEITVTAGGYESRDVSLVRNVSKIVIRIVDAAGLKTGGNHTVSLLEVPKSLTWAGGLYPNKTNPELSTLPMESAATISNGAGGTQTSNDMTFLVPAHQGSDFLSDSPTDLSTHHVTIQVDLEQESGSRLVKTAVLPVVPMANKIIDVNLSVKGQMSVDADVLDWKDVDVDGKLITKTTLNVSKTSCAMPWRDTVYVETNAADFTAKVKTGDTWLTTTKIDGNRVVIEAATSSYTDGSPRNSYVDIVANNVTKRINVTQRPDTGTITAPASFWVSPSTGNTSRTISVTSTGPWQILGGNPPNVLPGISSGGAGTTPITFQRQTSDHANGNYSAYGDADIRIKNTQSLEIITVKAINLFLQVPEQINVTGSGGTSYNDDIVVWGLSEEYVIKEVIYNSTGNNWLDVSIENGRLKTTAEREPNENIRNCDIVIAHRDDLTYTETINLVQDPHYDIIEPFTYLTGKFEWVSFDVDMDIAVFVYDDHGKSIFATGRYLGFNGGGGANADVLFRGVPIAKWGGDPVSNAKDIATSGEAFVIYMNAFDDLGVFPLDELDRFINIYMYAWWYSSSTAPDIHSAEGVTYLSLQYWLLGDIVPNKVGTSSAYVYTNPTGTNMNPDPTPRVVSPIKIRTVSASASNIINHSTGMTKVARVRYDRLTHKATPIWYTPDDIGNWPTTNDALPQSISAPLLMPTFVESKKE